MTASTSSRLPTPSPDTHSSHCRSCSNRQRSVFCEMEAASLTLIDTLKIQRSYRHGETIFLEGAAAAGLYCVEEGSVKIVKIGREGKELQTRIIRLLSEELQHTEERFVATAQHTVRQRHAEALVELKNTFGFEPDGETLDIRLRRTDLASLVGTAPESAIRILAEFKKAGIIDMEGRRIRILRPRTLRIEAGMEN